jgi:hypothetical protein
MPRDGNSQKNALGGSTSAPHGAKRTLLCCQVGEFQLLEAVIEVACERAFDAAFGFLAGLAGAE